MRPMTASEAWQIERDPYAAPDDWKQARLILSALVELREAKLAGSARFASRPTEGGLEAVREWMRPALERTDAAERKLAALERGESPKE